VEMEMSMSKQEKKLRKYEVHHWRSVWDIYIVEAENRDEAFKMWDKDPMMFKVVDNIVEDESVKVR